MVETVPSAGAGTLQIRLLGDLKVRHGEGGAASLPASRRTRALLGYLIATAAPQSRAALCDLLWDGPEDPRASLRWSLTKLRPVVDDAQTRRLVADREHVAFEPLRCEVDTVRVVRLLGGDAGAASLERLEEAAGLLRGEFLDGLDLPGCYRYHQWCMAERERLGKLRRAVLDALVARLVREPARALAYGRAMVAADPLDETAHATLVRLLAADGRYPEAERHYEWARDLLRREVSLAPGGALDETVRKVRRDLRGAGAGAGAGAAAAVMPGPGDHGAPHAAAVAGPATTDAPPLAAPGLDTALPLVGRAAELALIARKLAGGSRANEVLLFVGEPGIGKTSLLDHLAQQAAAAGRRVIRGRGFEAEKVRPYGLWLDALHALPTAGLAAATIEQAAPLLAGRATEGGSRESLFRAAAELLTALAALQPLVLIADDLQWIDEGSAALLHYVVRSLDAAAPIVVAAAARAGELEDNPSAQGLVRSLGRSGGVLRRVVEPLSEADACRIVETAPLDAADAVRRAGGNPLYLLELARAACRGGDPAAAGDDLHALIEARLQALDDGARDLLGWSAAMGGPWRPETLAAAAGLPLADVLARLDRFEQRGLLMQGTQGRCDFTHDVVRQVVYRGLSQPRRLAIHRQCARAFAAAATGDPGLNGEVVRHAALADDAPALVHACHAAAAHCLRVFANGQAGAVADQGLAHVGALTPGAERVAVEIGLLRLRVAAAAGPGGGRLPALAGRIRAAIDAAEALGLNAQAAAAWEILSFWQQQAGDPDQALEATLAAQRLARRADAATRCRQLANSGRCLLDIEADPVRGRALLAEAAALAAEIDLKVMEIDWGEGLIARADGDLARACTALGRAVDLARLTENHWREFECMVWLATAELEDGRLGDVLQHVEEIAAAAARMGERQTPFAQALGALARLRAGDHAAAGTLAESIGTLRTIDDKAHLAYALNEAAALAFEAGDRDAAEAHAAEALAAAEAVRRATESMVAAARRAQARRDAGLAAAWRTAIPTAPPSARAAAAVAAALATLGAFPTPASTQGSQAATVTPNRTE